MKSKNVTLRNKEVGARLKEWGTKRYGSVRALALALELKHPETLYQYVQGQSLPGNKMQERLRALGCDLNWLLGFREEPVAGARPESFMILNSPIGWPDDKRKELRGFLEEIAHNMPPDNVGLARDILHPLMKTRCSPLENKRRDE